MRATAYLKADGVPQPIFSMQLVGPFTLPAGITSETDRLSYHTDSETMQIVDMQAWTPHVLVMDIPQDTHHISFSLSLRGEGNGTIWLDKIELETVDDNVPVTGTSITSLLLQPSNLDFSHGFMFWQVKGEGVWHYEHGVISAETASGEHYVFLKSSNAESNCSCTLQQTVQGLHYWGKSIHLSASIKTTSAGCARFFVKPSSGQSEKCEEVIVGTTDWTEYHLTLPITTGAFGFVFGVTLEGSGQLWLKNIQFKQEEGVF
ncbi:MAG TPA: hypothetical protein VKY19_00420 [Ktedonosporobacter sp.]|nr:hypothetical protein [Ktedonosporobacter sp.]